VTEPKNIDEVILLIQQNPPILVKDKAGQVGNQKTKYANLEQVNEKVLPRLNELGTTYVCLPNMQDDGKFALEYELKHVPSGTVKGGKYPLKLSENPMQMGSAITYSRRYALLSVLGIVAEDEDDDGRGANDQPTAQRAHRQQQAAGNRPSAQRQSGGAPPLPGEQDLISQPQMAKMQAMFAEQGITTIEAKKAYLEGVVGHPLGSTKELTKDEAKAVIDRLESDGAGGER
jgi:hypothetical protein